jgi:hypothetical protein
MSEIVQTTSIQLVNPTTGELITLDSPTDDLANFLADMREHESLCREAKKLVTREVVSRMDKQASWTVHAGGLKLSTSSPAPTEEFDGPMLHEALQVLVDQGVISVEALDAAVETVIKYEPRRKGINALRKLGGRAAEIVNAHATEVHKDRYIKVERA